MLESGSREVVVVVVTNVNTTVPLQIVVSPTGFDLHTVEHVAILYIV